MGILRTRWEGSFRGHNLAVERDELSKGFWLEWDGVEIARRRWSWIGLGELHATADVDASYRESGHVDVQVKIEWGGVTKMAHGRCTAIVDGESLELERVA
jgi:hypothetical protein